MQNNIFSKYFVVLKEKFYTYYTRNMGNIEVSCQTITTEIGVPEKQKSFLDEEEKEQ